MEIHFHRANPIHYPSWVLWVNLTSFNYNYKEEVRFRNTDIDTPGDIGIVDAALGFHVYNNEGTINIASIGFGNSSIVIEACQEMKIKRVVFISTTSIYTSLNSKSGLML